MPIVSLAELLVALAILLAGAVSSALVVWRLRRRMERVLGRRASRRELVSLSAWMRVAQAEDQGTSARRP